MATRKTRRLRGTSSNENIATQTVSYNPVAEIANLKEQIRLLKIENELLKKNRNPLNGKLPKVTRELEVQKVSAPITPSKIKGCNCKGSCVNKVCGCVKRDVLCGEFCKCNDAVCRNQEPDKENIGDPNKQAILSKDGKESLERLSRLRITAPETSKGVTGSKPATNKRLVTIQKHKSPFSPDTPDNVFNAANVEDMENMTVWFDNPKRILTFSPTSEEANEEDIFEREIQLTRKRGRPKKDTLTVPGQERGKKITRSASNEENKSNADLPGSKGQKKRSISNEMKTTKAKSKSPNELVIHKRGRRNEKLVVKPKTVKDMMKEFKPLRRRARRSGNSDEENETVSDPNNVDEKDTKTKENKTVFDSNKVDEKDTKTVENGTVSDSNDVDDKDTNDTVTDTSNVVNEESVVTRNSEDDGFVIPSSSHMSFSENGNVESDTEQSSHKSSKESLTDHHSSLGDISNIVTKEKVEGTEMENNYSPPDIEIDYSPEFNPMKPSRTLLRSPIAKSGSLAKSEYVVPPRCSEVYLRPPAPELKEEELLPPEGFDQPEIDWDEHQKQLIPCKLCSRKFNPHRLKIHEAACKRV